MTIREKLVIELIKCENNIHHKILLKFKNKINHSMSDNEIFEILENLILDYGNEIINLSKNKNTNEKDIQKYKFAMISQNVYNTFLCEFKYKKYRPIYYERELSNYNKNGNPIKSDIKPLIFNLKEN